MAEIGASGRIVVGVDLSRGSRAAVCWAIRHARLTGATLVVVHVIRNPETYEWAALPTNYGTIPLPVRFDSARVRADAERSVTGLLKELGNDVPTEIRVIEGHPGEALLAAAKEADLLVVGRTGHGGLAGLVLGSISRHCVEHAPCAVVAVPADYETQSRPATVDSTTSVSPPPE